ncbi:L-fuculose phosphate aldolase [mine drainage metagenome]|uniref:L-fuculose phosphate aldolase n=1 Tax=mine drainage metagenome TaxID=410659 RepID=A0A1J5TBF1_9ZZZZ
MTEQQLRTSLLQTSRRMVELGLNRGTAGNASVRCGGDILITPSALPVAEMTERDMVLLDADGKLLQGGKPSSEWRFHRDILKVRPEIGAVLHMHSPFATTIACLGKDVPAVHYHIAIAGGDSIRCTPYTIFGEQNLSDLALEALRDRKACLLGNHGMIALGKDLAEALSVAHEVEYLCEIYWRTLQAGEPRILTAQQMHEVQEKFVGYKKRS